MTMMRPQTRFQPRCQHRSNRMSPGHPIGVIKHPIHPLAGTRTSPKIRAEQFGPIQPRSHALDIARIARPHLPRQSLQSRCIAANRSDCAGLMQDLGPDNRLPCALLTRQRQISLGPPASRDTGMCTPRERPGLRHTTPITQQHRCPLLRQPMEGTTRQEDLRADEDAGDISHRHTSRLALARFDNDSPTYRPDTPNQRRAVNHPPLRGHLVPIQPVAHRQIPATGPTYPPMSIPADHTDQIIGQQLVD